MAEYSTTVAPDKEVAVISDSEGEENDDNDGMVENFYDGSPHITLPPEVWANVIDCEYCCISINVYQII